MTATAGVRLADLAKELKMSVPELSGALADIGVEKSGAGAVLDAETAETVRSLLAKAAAAGKTIEFLAEPTVKELATSMGVKPNDAQKKLVELGELVAINQKLSRSLAERLASAYDYSIEWKSAPKPAATTARAKYSPANGQAKNPVVTIMGHVDHGKTTLLDTIRKANVVGGEFGGITQHIGAYQISTEHNGEQKKITFLDTPGHAAFTEMRARGASVTDIVILVVAADDGIMPQTIEAINHAQAAQVPIIVAVNKMDLPDANPDKIKQQLTEYNLVVEDYGGDVIAVPLSAKAGQGVPELLDYILLVAELQELKADPNGIARGTVIEAKIEPGRGPVATILVQAGTLRVGDNVVAGATFGKVRAMTNERGERLQKAGPATPVEVTGLSAAPNAGDAVEAVKNDREARQLAETRGDKDRNTRMKNAPRSTLADLAHAAEHGETKDLNLILKGDVQGSVEAVLGQINKLESEKTEAEVRLSVKHSAIGNINESDVLLAAATASVVIGFNVRSDAAAQRAAEREGVEIRIYNIIYDLVEDVDRIMKGRLTPVFEENPLGRATVRQSFKTPRGTFIAGCYVNEGLLRRGTEVRLVRGRDTLFTGRLESLRHVKDDVREMAAGFECGVVIQDWNEGFEVGDVLDCFEMKQVMRT